MRWLSLVTCSTLLAGVTRKTRGAAKRGAVSTLAASIIALVAISQIVATIYSTSSSYRQLAETVYILNKVASADVRLSKLPNGTMVLRSTAPVKLLAVYAIRNGTIVGVYGDGVVSGEYILPYPTNGADKLLAIMEGGRYVVAELGSSDPNSSGYALLDGLGYKLSMGFLISYMNYVQYGPIHTRYALSQPPTGGDTGYKAIVSGNVVFFYTGLTYSIPSGSYWWITGEGTLALRPNHAIAATGISSNPAAVTQVLRVLRASGVAEISVRMRVEVVNTSTTSYYPVIVLVCYVLPPTANLALPVAYFQPPALEHYPWISRRILEMGLPGQTLIEYSTSLVLSGLPAESYILIGAEVLTYGIDTVVKVTISI